MINKCNCGNHADKAVIIPDNDYVASVIDRNLKQLEPFFYCPHIGNSPGEISKWMDKERQKEKAEAVGLSVARAVTLELNGKYPLDLDASVFPCFVKPLMSSDCGKIGIGRCDNLHQLETHLELMRKVGAKKVLVEEYKEIETEYATLGISDGSRVYIPGLLQLLRIAHSSHMGVAIQGKVFPIDGYEELVDRFAELIREIGFVGLFDIDFYLSKGVFYFGELNLRFGGSGYAFTRMGANLPAAFVNYCYGESVNPFLGSIKSEATYMNERMAVDDWYRGYLSSQEFADISKESQVFFVKDSDDQIPYWVFEYNLFKKRFSKLRHKWMNQ